MPTGLPLPLFAYTMQATLAARGTRLVLASACRGAAARLTPRDITLQRPGEQAFVGNAQPLK